mgnify:CR=1 FL=1
MNHQWLIDLKRKFDMLTKDLSLERLRGFQETDEQRWNENGEDGSIPDAEYKLTIEADAALTAARAEMVPSGAGS